MADLAWRPERSPDRMSGTPPAVGVGPSPDSQFVPPRGIAFTVVIPHIDFRTADTRVSGARHQRTIPAMPVFFPELLTVFEG